MVGTRAAALIVAVLIAAHPARADRFSFDVQNGRGAGGLVFSVPADPVAPTTRWTRSIRIVGTEDAVVSTEHLVLPAEIVVETETGDTAKLTPSALPPKQDLMPGMSLVIDLNGAFTVPGVYKGELVLVLAGTPPRQHVVPIQITVTPAVWPVLPAMPVEDRSAKAVAVTEDVFGAVPTTLAIRLRNAATELLTVTPAFATVVRVDKADAPTYQIAVPEAKIAVPDAQIAGPDAHVATPDARAKGSGRNLPAGDIVAFDLPVDKLDEPGIYIVETMFTDARSPPKYQAQTVKTIVYRRQSGWWAAFAIALGAVLAFLVKAFVSDGSKRLALRRRIALLGEHVRAVRSEAGSEPLMNAARLLELDVADRDRDARWGNSVNDVEKIVARAEKRLALLRSVVAASATLVLIDADKQADARQKLDDALLVVRVDPGDDDKIAAAQDAIDKLALGRVRRDQLVARLTDLKTLIAQQQAVGSAALVAALVTVERSLAPADLLIRTDDLDKLGKLIEQAVGSVLDACIAELTRLAGAVDPPPGVAATDWAIAAAEVKSWLGRATGGWKERNTALLEAETSYFTAAVKGLIKRAREQAASNDSRAAAFTAMADDLEAKLKASPLVAAAAYSQCLRQLEAPDPAVIAKGPKAFAPEVTPAAGWIPLLLGAVHDAVAPGDRAGSVALDRKLRTTTWLVNVVVLVIAVASGLKTLWLDNLSWGGTSAWVAAFLWGAGVQAAGDACAGIAGLRARLSASAGS